VIKTKTRNFPPIQLPHIPMNPKTKITLPKKLLKSESFSYLHDDIDEAKETLNELEETHQNLTKSVLQIKRNVDNLQTSHDLKSQLLNSLQEELNNFKNESLTGDRAFEKAQAKLESYQTQMNELQLLISQERSKVLCGLCKETKKDVILLPCSHFYYCQKCAFGDGKMVCGCGTEVTGYLKVNSLGKE